MKITYITHACLLIEINKIKILTDPWLVGPSWGGSLWHYPTHKFKPSNLPVPDIIFFSHGHDDHYHDETISNFPKSWFKAKIIAPKFNVKWWDNEIQKKFKNIIFLKHNQNFTLKNEISLQMFINEFDSSLKIKFNNKCVFLQTDNLMSEKEAKRISKIDPIDVAFVIPFLTGVFPGFYKWDSDTLIKLANDKIYKSLNFCTNIIKNLNPKYVIPYACDLGYLGEKFYINLIHRHNKEDLVKLVKSKKLKTKPIILNSGVNIDISNKFKLNLKNKLKISTSESLIRFANEKHEEYKKYKDIENRLKKPDIKKLTKKFCDYLAKNMNLIKKFNFEVIISIVEDNKKTYILLNFKNKKLKIIKKKKENVNLFVEIESLKIRNLFLQKYPMNFLTFHNGGYTCERKVMNLSSSERKYWSWINNLDFFI